jgi:hypothetical protein
VQNINFKVKLILKVVNGTDSVDNGTDSVDNGTDSVDNGTDSVDNLVVLLNEK